MNSTNLKSPVPAALEELKEGQHLMMTIAAKSLLKKFDDFVAQSDESLFASLLFAHFGPDFKALRNCINNAEKLNGAIEKAGAL